MHQPTSSSAACTSSLKRLAHAACLFATVATLAACGGGGTDTATPPPVGGTPSPTPTPPPPPASGNFTVSGRATFASVPAAANGGLNYSGTTFKPVRGATVQLIDGSGNVLATTQSNAAGDYSFGLASSQSMRVRVRAELLATNHDFKVRDNTSSNALYVMDSAAFTPTNAATTIDVAAASGWGGSSYTGLRVAGPFAILDVAYAAKEKVLATSPSTNLPALSLYWSPNNRPAQGQLAAGNIGTSFFTVSGNAASLYLLGAENSDTDEYDMPVVAHEIGHYMQYAVSRDDSEGGQHSGSDKLDMRIAFSEGWGNAWASMVLNNPIYHDSRAAGQQSGFSYSLATAPAVGDRGWFNENTVGFLLWQSHQDAGIGFAPIYSALTSLRNSPAFTSIHNFTDQLKAAAPSAAGTITSRAATMGVNGTDIYGAGESNTGGVAQTIPVYKAHTAALGATQQYCVVSPKNGGNKLGDYAYIRFTASGVRTITVTRAAGTVDTTDPDLFLTRSDGGQQTAYSSATNQEVLTVSSALSAGSHVLALNDFNIDDPDQNFPVTQTTRCFDVRID